MDGGGVGICCAAADVGVVHYLWTVAAAAAAAAATGVCGPLAIAAVADRRNKESPTRKTVITHAEEMWETVAKRNKVIIP